MQRLFVRLGFIAPYEPASQGWLLIFGFGLIFFGVIALAAAADLPIPRKTKVSVTMTREKGPAPVYEPPTKPEMTRPAGMP